MNTDEKLIQLGFTAGEIKDARFVLANTDATKEITSRHIIKLGVNNIEYAKKIKYLCDIICGTVLVETIEEYSKHFKKMSVGIRNLTIDDLKYPKSSEMQRYAVVGGIQDKVYGELNCIGFNAKRKGLYRVARIKPGKVTICTDAKLQIPYGYKKAEDGSVELLGKNSKGIAIFDVDKKNCRLCNRYVIVASFKKPNEYLSMVRIVCYEGSILYVYAKNAGTTSTQLNMAGGNSRAYTYGCNLTNMKNELIKVAQVIYKNMGGKKYEIADGNVEFSLIEKKPIIEDLQGLNK